MKSIVFVLTWFACNAFAFEQPAFDPLCPSCTSLTVSAATVQMERIDAVTGKDVVIGAAYKFGVLNLIGTPPLLFDVIGPKTSQVGPPTVTSLKWTLTVTGEKGLRVEPIVAHQDIETPFTLPLAAAVGCRYDMPDPEISLSALVAPLNALLQKGPVTEKQVNDTLQGKTVKLGPPPRSGTLHCEPGVKAAAIPAPIVVTPVVPPVVVPPVVTPPVVTVSKTGDSSPPLPQLVTADLAVWKIDPATGAITRNGVNMNPPYTDFKAIQISPNGTGRLWGIGSVHGYACHDGAAWVYVGC